MRNLFFLVVIFFCMFTDRLKAKEDDSYLIKRAYIDTIGVVPTTEEIEWYLVYNTNGYELAIDTLINNPKYKGIKLSKEYLNSSNYKNADKVNISEEQIIRNILFVVGMDINLSQTKEHILIAKELLISNAILCSDGDSQIIDYICNNLMCRDANITEANNLLKLHKSSGGNELESWKIVLEEILKLEDVRTK